MKKYLEFAIFYGSKAGLGFEKAIEGGLGGEIELVDDVFDA